ncbi:MAG TPA: hypothetical protein VHB53_04395 [Solirubrobacterales bacterium]|nr:hypothetical protein [Solirubrobacterales bacterium]
MLFVSEQDHIDRIVPPSPGPLVIASTVKAPEVHSTRATLRAAVNPEGKSTMVRFEYVDEATYQEDLPNGFEHAQVSPTGAPIGSDSTLHLGEFEATGLAPETTYRFRAVAEDDEGRLADGEGSFKTLPPFEAKATWATGVSTSGATLHAEVNPLGTAATARFEYVSGGQFQESGFVGASSLPSTPIDLGAGESPVEASVALAGLAPATTYYYRVSVSDHCKPDPGVVCTFEGPTRYLITFGPAPQPDVDCPNQAFRVGPSAQLANCRAYEMVSPVEKNNVDVYPLLNLNSNRAILDQSSSEGSRFTYTTSQGFGDAEGTPYVSQYLASRTGSGWTDTGLATAQGLTSTEPGNRVDLEYRAFTPDLCTGALRNETNALLAPGAIPNTENLYLRRSCGGTTLEALGVGSRPDLSPFPSGYRADIQGLSADGRCVVYKYAGAHEKEQLWEVCAGQPPLPVGILPDGAESSSGAAAGTENSGGEGIRTANVLGAISADGTKLYWTAAGEGDGPLYLRLNADQPQSALSGSRCTEPAKGCTVPVSIEANSHFWAASPDGDTALYTVRDESAFDLDSFDATRRRSTEIASGVTDIVGASADARAVAFVSDEVLTSESNPQGSSPTAGGNNLYLYDPDSSGSSDFHFIATLAAEDVEAVGNFFSPVAPQPYLHTSRVSADGHHVVFMSRARLTGYDNTDSQSRDPVAEIYTYSEGETSGGSSLSCVSCNPSNQLPVGVKVSVEGAPEFLLAAALLPPFQTQLHGATAISSDGDRIFFDSYEALVPTDTDGTTDVYEWEAPGSSSAGGRCTVQRPTYSAVSGGCISLISSGDSEAPAELLDADPDGRDVFFSTSTSLLPQDPGLVDIYDAREGGGFPLQASGGTPCEGQGCQAGQSPPAAAAPQTGVARRGNPRRTCPKGRRKVRHHGKLRCVSRRHRRHGKRHHKKRKAARHHGRRHGGGKGR